MQSASQIKKYVESVPPGKIITYQDFNAIQKVKPQALAKALERLVKQRFLATSLTRRSGSSASITALRLNSGS
jgi:alkylated DNA nucleotide flippase Atl1